MFSQAAKTLKRLYSQCYSIPLSIHFSRTNYYRHFVAENLLFFVTIVKPFSLHFFLLLNLVVLDSCLFNPPLQNGECSRKMLDLGHENHDFQNVVFQINEPRYKFQKKDDLHRVV